MGNPLNSESRELLKMLLDGEWRPVDDVRKALIARVTPGRALRTYEVRQATRTEKVGPRRRAERSEDERIRSGAHTLASAALYSMRNYLAYRDGDGDTGKLVRLRDDIPNPLRPLSTNPNGLTEETIRTIVREEIQTVLDEALDEFHDGMLRYLDNAFASLDESVRRRHRERRTDNNARRHEQQGQR